MRRTRFICTLGPASDSEESLSALIGGGADVFRLNMSHASHQWAREVCGKIRKASAESRRQLGILFDLQGPSIRTGDLAEPFDLSPGDRLEFRVPAAAPSLPFSATVNYAGLMGDVSVGDTLLIDNGALLAEIESTEEERIVCAVRSAGVLGSRRHINLPGVRLSLPSLTGKDREDLALAVECEADFIAASYVRDASHVSELRSVLESLGSSAQVIAKLEDQEGVSNLDEIILASDLVMVARGDLGIEVRIEELPILQRRVVKRCHVLGRRVIVATHLLESMIRSPTPTRAEVTDVANAVCEEADALMLSGETSIGKYPLRSLQTLNRVARRTERSGGLQYASLARLETGKQKAVHAAVTLADSLPDALLAVFTRSGSTANQAALRRPRAPVYAFAPDEHVCRGLCLSRGVLACRIPFSERPRDTIRIALETLRPEHGVADGTPVVMLSDTLLRGKPRDSILLEYTH